MIKKNDILDLTIEDLGVNGEGIGKVDGYTLFVKDGVIGDKVTVKVMKANKSFAKMQCGKTVWWMPNSVH